MSDKKLVFIGTCLSHEDSMVKAERLRNAAKFTAWLVAEQGVNVFSAPGHNQSYIHILKDKYGKKGWNLELMRPFLKASDAMYVLRQHGWEDSNGLKAEMQMAEEEGKPILHYRMEGDNFIAIL